MKSCASSTSGKNVVTPVGWFYPFSTPGVAELEAACRAGGVSLHGTGLHPGGITELLPLTLSRLTRNVTHVRAEEFSDIRVYRAEMVVREIMMFGKSPEEARVSPMLDLLGFGFGQSIDMLADALGLRLDAQKATAHAMAVATAPIDTPVGVLAPGTVAAQRFTWQGTVDGRPVITVRVNWLMGEAHLDPPWTIGGERFEVEVQGDPSPPPHPARTAAAVRERRSRPQPRHRRDRDALRELDPRGVRGTTGHPHLPRPAADHRLRRGGPAALTGGALSAARSPTDSGGASSPSSRPDATATY